MSTIWSHGALNDVPPSFRPLYRIVFPIMDLMLIGFGLIALTVGSPAIQSVTFLVVSDTWAALLTLTAALALISLISQWLRFEIWAKIVLAPLLLVYALWAFISPTQTGAVSSFLGAFLAVFAASAVGWRIFDLSGRIARR